MPCPDKMYRLFNSNWYYSGRVVLTALGQKLSLLPQETIAIKTEALQFYREHLKRLGQVEKLIKRLPQKSALITSSCQLQQFSVG